jgi:hypothetical protein
LVHAPGQRDLRRTRLVFRGNLFDCFQYLQGWFCPVILL